MSHTPGPWRISGLNDGTDTFGVFSGEKVTDSLTGKEYYPNCQQVLPFYNCDLFRSKEGHRHMSDARLIAAAPDLLAALENLSLESIGYLQDLSSNHVDATTLVGAIRQAKAAIKKAREGDESVQN